MWLGIKFGVLFLISTVAAQDYYEANTFDLRSVIPGEPEVDYPVYSVAPRTSFTCVGKHEGYYADMETRCQVFRICSNTDFTGRGFPFLCPNGTLFNQKHFVCDWYRNVDCNESGDFYYKNSENALESKEQMMRKAQLMVDAPMRSYMNSLKATTTRLPTTVEAVTHPAVIRHPNNPQHARETNEVFVSSLGELSSDPRTTFNPDTSVIINNESPSRLLEAPKFIDLTSFASNINGLVDDVEAEGELIPNVVSARSPKIPSGNVKSKGFSMPRKNYRKIQEEQAKLNPPSTVQPVYSVPVNNYQPFVVEGRSQQSFYPQQNPYFTIPRSSAVTTQRPEISFHTHLQKIHPDIVIARSEEHAPFPLESRTARATPAPPASGQYVPLKQYINQNFPTYRQPTKKPATQKSYPNYSYTQPQNAIQYKPQPVQYQPRAVNKISTVQEKIPLFPPLVQLKSQPQAQTKKQNFQTYQQFAFKTIPIAQRRFGLAEFDEDKKPNYSLFNGVSSYDVPLSSIGVLRTIHQQRLQNQRTQG